MSSNKNITATFNLLPVAENITSSIAYTDLATALSVAHQDNEIRTRDMQLTGPFSLNTGLLLNGGWDTGFLAQNSGNPTTISGGLTIVNGASTAYNMAVMDSIVIQGGSLLVNGVTVAP